MEPEDEAAGAGQPICLWLRPAEFAQATGTDDEVLGTHLVSQAANALPGSPAQPESERLLGVRATVAALKGLAPRDAGEGLMATQMVAIHNVVMDSLRRAQADGPGGEVRDRSIRQAARLSELYLRQAEALDRRRGRAGHRITVEQVTVEAGGQAVVGAVTTGTAQVTGPAARGRADGG